MLKDRATDLLLSNFDKVVSEGLKSAETAADGKGDN